MPITTPCSVAALAFPADQEPSLLDLKEASTFAQYSWTIETRYLGPTANRGGRIRACFAASNRRGAITVPYRHALTSGANHLSAALAFLRQLSNDNGAVSYRLVAQFSGRYGDVFTFI